MLNFTRISSQLKHFEKMHKKEIISKNVMEIYSTFSFLLMLSNSFC